MKLCVIDLPNVFWSTALSGAASSSVRESVLRQCREMADGYDRAVACVDGGKSFRVNLWPKYKASRRERPAEMWSLLADTVGALDAAGFHVLHAPAAEDDPTVFFEADDVIATVARWALDHGHTCDVYSGDSDMAQLVRPGVRLMRRKAKGGIQAIEDPDQVVAWIGVSPSLVVDAKALMGDATDGYLDLFPGVGEKAAIELLKWAGSGLADVPGDCARRAVEKCIGKTDGVAKKINAVPEPIARLELGIRLAALRYDVPIDLRQLETAKEPRAEENFLDRLIPDAEYDAPPMGTNGAPIMPPTAVGHAIVVTDPTARMLAPAEEARNRLIEFKAFVNAVLTPHVDYGFIPGVASKTPSLWKGGAEKIAEIYGYAWKFDYMSVTEQWERSEPLFFYRVKCTLLRKSDGMFIGEKVGSCNSRETRYSGRWVYERQIPAHLDAARLKTREYRSKESGQTVKQWRIPNEDIYDQVHTIEAMAQKRAFVGAVIIATRSGSIFTDLDHVPEAAGGKPYDEPQWAK
jgi:5'-3' exonuclease